MCFVCVTGLKLIDLENIFVSHKHIEKLVHLIVLVGKKRSEFF